MPDDILDGNPTRAYFNPRYQWAGLDAAPVAGAAPALYEQARVIGGGSSINARLPTEALQQTTTNGTRPERPAGHGRTCCPTSASSRAMATLAGSSTGKKDRYQASRVVRLHSFHMPIA